MALDDPNITKVIFESFGQMKELTVGPRTMARLACVIRDESKWHVELIDFAPGVYTVEAKKDPKKKIWFETICRKSYLPRKKKGRYS